MTHRRLPAARVATPDEAAKLCAALTPRERETLVLVLQAYSTKEIARSLGLAIKTVEATRMRTLERLGAQNMVHAAVIGTKAGLV